MQQSVSKYFVLAFGAKDPQGQRVEIRNERLELLGNCRIDDLEQMQRFLGQSKQHPQLLQLLATLPVGKITSIVL